VNVWRTHDSRVAAFGYTVEGEHWLHLPGVASYRFGVPAGPVVALPHEPVSSERVVDAYRRTVLPLVFQARGKEILHASAVRIGQRVVAFCGASEAGKSTIAYGLGRRGHEVWADDAVTLEPMARCVLSVRLPFRIRLLRDAFDFLGMHKAPRLSEEAQARSRRPVRLGAIFVLHRSEPEGDTVVRVNRLMSARAFRTVLEHAYCFNPAALERRRDMMQRYLDLTRRVPVFEVRYRRGLKHLSAILGRIEREVESLRLRPF
jgi:hypothetical protein